MRIVLGAFCLLILSLSAQWTRAYLDLQVMRQLLRDSLTSSTQSEALFARIEHAAVQQPLNADIYATLGLALTMLPMSSEPNGPPRVSMEDGANAALLKALQLRPGSGHLWAQYAESLFASEGFSPRVRYAIDRSWGLAPLQHTVVTRVFWLYMTASRDAPLTGVERTRFAKATDWMQQKEPGQLRAMLDTPGLVDELLALDTAVQTRNWLGNHRAKLLNQ